MRFPIVCLIFLLIFGLVDPVQSALKTQTSISKEACVNPRPDSGDIILPMPCGLTYVLRTVAVPGGVNHDRRFFMGIHHFEEERQMYEGSFESHIAASFDWTDLPIEWTKRLGVKEPKNFSYYFIGKYEVSSLQWETVTKAIANDGLELPEQCPTMKNTSASLPIRSISWYEVQDFLRRYTAWLLKNAPQVLPKYAGTKNIGFLRLPTEEEWEFAARGGIAVREEDRQNNDSFVVQGEKPEEYGVFVAEGVSIPTKPLPIGSRKPNPLMLYDTMGNVREMIDGFFHMTVEEMKAENRQRRRLHGSSGGLLCKGGSFRSELQGVLPGARDEVPLYTESGEYRAHDLGFRLVLAGMNIPNAKRLELSKNVPPEKEPLPKIEAPKKEQKEEIKNKEDTVLTINRHGDLLAELDRISNATASTTVRANLAQLRSMVSERMQAEERKDRDALESTLRSTLYQAETIRAFAFRYLEVSKILEGTQAKEMRPAQKQQAEEMQRSYYHVLLTAANQYKSHLRRIVAAQSTTVQELLSQMSEEYGEKDTLGRHMQQNRQTLIKHIEKSRREGVDALSREEVCRDIIPKQHLEQMRHFSKK